MIIRCPLYLLGGEAALARSAPAFVREAGGPGGRVALLLQGGVSLNRYVSRYVRPWQACGLGAYEVVAADENGQLDEAAAQRAIERASAIFIGGGSTAVYHQRYASGPIAERIRARCAAVGLPYGGLSAGMLIAGEVCPLDPEETGAGSARLVRGLGLFNGVLVEPHFTIQNRLAQLSAHLAQAGIPEGWGVDDDSCLVLRPGALPEAIGTGVYHVTAPGPEER